MKNGWYILNYHDISWEEGILLRGLGGTFPPDIFRSHLESLVVHGKFVSIKDGYERHGSSKLDEPLISLWFDDAYAGVRKYAFPLMEKYNIKGAVSVSSKFVSRTDMFWRLKLSFISQTDGLRFLRTKLRKFGYDNQLSVRRFVMDHFSQEIVCLIDSVYSDFSNETFRKDAFRVFDDFEGIGALSRNGWEICNHTASHYPVGEKTCINRFKEEFEECEAALKHHLNVQTKYWVIPFDRDGHRSHQLLDVFNISDKNNRCLVLVGNKFNNNRQTAENILYRIALPMVDGLELVKFLSRIPSN